MPTQLTETVSKRRTFAIISHPDAGKTTLTEKLLYLADYIDETRLFENCVMLRGFFWGANPQSMDMESRETLLRDTMILSYRMTIEDLLAEGMPIAPDTVAARNQLLLEAVK